MANIDTKTFLNPDAIGTGTITGAKIKNETIWPNKLVYPTINSAFAEANSDGINLATNVGPVEVASMFDNNVAFYAKADGIKVEYSRDGGENWYEYNINNYDNNVRKVNMVSGITTNYYAGGRNHQILDTTTGELSVNADSSRTHGTPNDMLRFTFDAKGMGIYAMIMQIYVLVSTSGGVIEENGSYTGKLHVKLESASMKSLDNFVPITDKITVTGWSGWNAIPINRRFGSSGWNTNDDFTGRLRLTFYCDEVKSTKEWFSVWQFKFLSSDAWAFPSEMAKNNHLYEAGIRDITYGNDNYGNPGLIATPSMILPGEIKPKTTDKYDNGSIDKQWRNIYGQNIYENGTSLSEKYLLNTDNVVTTAKINNNAVTSEKISNGAVTYTKLATDSVIAGKIKNGAVTTNKIADDAVTNAKINNLAVTTDKIADSAVINSKIHDNAITTAKIHNLDVTNDKIANKTITGGKIKNQTIWSNKLTWQTLSDASSDVDSSGILYTTVGPVETAAMFDNNVLSLGYPDGLLVEYARDYGHLDDNATWYEYYFSNIDKNYSDIRKVNMMTNGNPDSFAYFAGGRNYKVTNFTTGTLYASNDDTDPNRKRASDGDALRFTFDAKSLGVYAQVVQIYAFISTNGSNITVNNSLVSRLKVKLETSTVSNPNSFTTVADNITVTGWSGWNAIPFNGNRFGHPNYTNISNSNDYVQKIRLTFTSEGALSDGNNWFQVNQFKFLATDAWGFPSELAKNKHLYKTDIDSIVPTTINNVTYRVPRPNMVLTGNIKPNESKKYDNGSIDKQWKNIYGETIYGETIYEGNKKLSDKYVPYKDDGTSLVEGKLKSYVGYGYQNNTGAYSGLFISGAHVNGTHGGQLNGSFDGEHLSYRAYNNGTFTDWKELAFKSQIDTLSNSTQKAVYDYLSSPDNISDTTTNPTLLAKSNGTHEGTFSFYDTKFYNSQSASSNRAQVAYGYDNDYIGYRRYYDGTWTDWRNVAFEGHTHQPVVVRLYTKPLTGHDITTNVYIIDADVTGYNGPDTDIVTIENGYNNIYIHNTKNKFGVSGCLVDYIIDDIDASKLSLFTNNESIYNIYIPDAYLLNGDTYAGNIVGKKITLIKNHKNQNPSIVNKIRNYIYTNREDSIHSPNPTNDTYYYFAYPTKDTNCKDANSNFNMYVTKYNLTGYLVNTCKNNNTDTNNMYLSTIELISNGKYWIVNNVNNYNYITE